MKIDPDKYLVKTPVDLSTIPTHEDFGVSDLKLEKELKKVRVKLGDFQNTLYAHGKYGVLVCIQGMDTAGKDSLIREIFKDFNARGIVVHSFKSPSALELRHDFLWRHYIALPEKGKFSVFNRTHYENVLISRVHPEFVLGEKIPGIHSVDDIDTKFWQKRFKQINNFENHIYSTGTIVFKFFLHISKDEQKDRLIRRLELKRKNWKFSPDDLKERELWDEYQSCYEDAINNTSAKNTPWHIIPSDNKDAARLIVTSIMHKKLKEYKDIKEPTLDPEIQKNIDTFIDQLKSE
ncbi:PPK2 family polyphosphate kinase [Neptunitalea lumnitzerae]|uniref:Polyphosphate kinase n=1 Tax=Neptunitalea lumnitzerae TaxID=2965509 RepID=A0ABQ5MMF9_9FLAO|nr:PPK2 family polyphosphate kinase [Neptunitalea sp. Y10]GLB50595.1 polyphosphate kinase [Neptunitalea sp. Y10]